MFFGIFKYQCLDLANSRFTKEGLEIAFRNTCLNVIQDFKHQYLDLANSGFNEEGGRHKLPDPTVSPTIGPAALHSERHIIGVVKMVLSNLLLC